MTAWDDGTSRVNAMRTPKPDWIDYLSILIAAAILAWQLFVPPVIGLANNGDFGKVIGGFNLGAPFDDEYKFAPTTYSFDPRRHIDFEFYSTEVLLIGAAVGLSRLLGNAATFDLRFIGLVHGLLYLAALSIVLPLLRTLDKRARVLSSLVLIFVYCDVMYVSELNSFFMDTPAFVFFLLSAGFVCRILKWKRRRDIFWFVVCCLCLIDSKTQHAPLGLLIALMVAIRPAVFLPDIPRVLRLGVITALVAMVAFSWKAAPSDYAINPLFTDVFYGILPRVKDPVRELGSLELDASYQKYIGMHAYSDPKLMADTTLVHAFLGKVSTATLAWYFLKHPALAYALVVHGLSEAGRQRVYMGNFDRSTGRPPFAESYGFSVFSSVKRRMFEEHGLLFLTYTLILGTAFSFLLLITRGQLAPGFAEAGWTMVAMMIAAMLIAELGDGLDFVRHSFVFIGISDTVLVALVIGLIVSLRGAKGLTEN